MFRIVAAFVALVVILLATVGVEHGTRAPFAPRPLPPLVVETSEGRTVVVVDVADPVSLDTVAGLPPEADPAIADWVVENADALTPPFLALLGERLYGDDRDRAARWYHLARIRGIYDALRCTGEAMPHAMAVLDGVAPRLAAHLEARPAVWYRTGRGAVDLAFERPVVNSPWWTCRHATGAARSDDGDARPWLRPEGEWESLREEALARYRARLDAVTGRAGGDQGGGGPPRAGHTN